MIMNATGVECLCLVTMYVAPLVQARLTSTPRNSDFHRTSQRSTKLIGLQLKLYTQRENFTIAMCTSVIMRWLDAQHLRSVHLA